MGQITNETIACIRRAVDAGQAPPLTLWEFRQLAFLAEKQIATKQAEAPTASNERPDALQIADLIDPLVRKQAPDHLTMAAAAKLLRALATQQEAQPQAERDGDVDRLLRAMFELCEATEEAPEIEPKNEHQRGFEKGRRFEAKSIRRSIGAWFQEEFCGRSFMGEPVIVRAARAAQQATGERDHG